MKQVSYSITQKLIACGFKTKTFNFIPDCPKIDEVIKWLNTRNVFIESFYNKEFDNYCYRYYSKDKDKESTKYGCRRKNGFKTIDEALEKGIEKLLSKS